MQDNNGNGHSNGNGHGNSNGAVSKSPLKPYVARLYPRPKLPSEYAQRLQIEREQIFAEIYGDRRPHTLISRLEQLAEVIDAEDSAIPLHLEEEDSLVTKVDEALTKTNGRH